MPVKTGKTVCMMYRTLCEAALVEPERLSFPSAWAGHVPFAHWLGMTMRPKVFVELGTHYGHSYFNLCAGIRVGGGTTRCFAVDTWEGDPQAGFYGEDVYRSVERHNRGISGVESTLLRMSFSEALERFEDGSVDLLHIDGRHEYEAVREDFESWLPKLSSNAVVLFHDTGVRKEGFGVWRFWEEVCGRYPHHLEFPHSKGLGVACVAERREQVPLAWLRESESSGPFLQSYFRMRGEEATRRNLPAAAAMREDPELRLMRAQTRLQDAEDKLEQQKKEWWGRVQNEKHRRQCRERSVLERLHAARARELRVHTSAWLSWITAALRLETRFPRAARCLALPPKVVAWAIRGRLRKELRIRKEARTVAECGYFDPLWYVQANPDLDAHRVHPLHHWLCTGWKEGRNPGPRFDTVGYLEANPDVAASGVNPLVHYVRYGQAEERSLGDEDLSPAEEPRSMSPPSNSRQTPAVPALQMVRSRFPFDRPLSLYPDGYPNPRVTVVTDGLDASRMFGGVTTAILLGTRLAAARGATLRILTLWEEGHGEDVARIQRLHGLEFTGNLEFACVGNRPGGIPWSDQDLVVTTSWWTTRQFRHSVPPDRIVTLVQEDERMFYPHGDERVRCEETLLDGQIPTIVNSRLLYTHLLESGLGHLRDRGVSFEPAFPSTLYYPETRERSGRKRFFFYARPEHARNLYVLGLEALCRVMETGGLPEAEWEIVFAGSGVPEVELPGGARPVRVENVPAAEYAQWLRGTDAGLALIDTPHPGYPVLDLAACGAVAVTNRFGPKRSLERYSPDILCVEPTVDGLAQGISEAIRVVLAGGTRSERHARCRVSRDWTEAFRPVVEWLGEA